MAYKTTIGLEIHAELNTKTKMFCASKNDPDEKRPNVNICAVCMGHPGTLPVINKEAVKHVLKVGAAIDGEFADFTEFDRKNYFYPDIPKGYQISQYKYPLITGGMLAGVKLTRIHLEEDTARSSHDGGGEMGETARGAAGIAKVDIDYSLVDFNRAGVPLMEMVTEPVIHSGEEASRFAKELQLLLQYLGVGEANMEKGEMRVEANISVATEEATAAKKFGTKVEVKNLNSFKAVERAVAYEVERHIRALENGEKIAQETRGWDEVKQVTFSQRAKEDSHDYRYFPDPDLPKLHISEIPEFSKVALRAGMPELPWQKRERLMSAPFELKPVEAEIFVSNPILAKYFDDVSALLKEKYCSVRGSDPKVAADAKKLSLYAKLASNYLLSDYVGLVKTQNGSLDVKPQIPAADFCKLIFMIDAGQLGSRAAKDILAHLYANKGGDADEIAKTQGLLQTNDEEALKTVMRGIIAANPKPVADYKAGKLAALQSLIGQGMKATKGSANPELLRKISIELL